MIIGGLYGSQTAGREMVMRLARHLGAGAKASDDRVGKILNNIDVYLVPAIDKAGFAQVNEGKKGCMNLYFLMIMSFLLNIGNLISINLLV